MGDDDLSVVDERLRYIQYDNCECTKLKYLYYKIQFFVFNLQSSGGQGVENYGRQCFAISNIWLPKLRYNCNGRTSR